MRSFTSIPGRRINNDAVDQSLISMNPGFRVLGTDSGTSDAINVLDCNLSHDSHWLHAMFASCLSSGC